MKKIFYALNTTAVLFLPLFTNAQVFAPDGGPFGQLLKDLLQFINDVVIPFIIGIGFLFFVWGMFRFFILGGADDESKEKGKSLMIWSTVGFVMIIIFFGIVNMITSSTGLEEQELDSIPSIDVP